MACKCSRMTWFAVRGGLRVHGVGRRIGAPGSFLPTLTVECRSATSSRRGVTYLDHTLAQIFAAVKARYGVGRGFQAVEDFFAIA